MTPLENLAIGALEGIHVAALFELALVAVVDQLTHFRLEFLQDQRDVIDVLLHLLVIALVGLGDQFVDLSMRNLVEDAIAFADRQKNGVEHLIDAFEDLAIGALEGTHVAALFQHAFVAVFDQLAHFRMEFLQNERDAIDILLHLFMIALVGLGDQFVDLSVRDLIENTIAFTDRQENRVEQLVDIDQNFFVVA